MTTVEPKEGLSKGLCESIRELAIQGLQLRVRPILDHGTTISRKLFELEDETRQRQAALDLLRESYNATSEDDLSNRDRKIYDREFSRRQKQLDALGGQWELMLMQYGEELLRSNYQHPNLIKLSQSISRDQKQS